MTYEDLLRVCGGYANVYRTYRIIQKEPLIYELKNSDMTTNAGPMIREHMRKEGVSVQDVANKMQLTRQRVDQLLKQDDMMISTALKVLNAIGGCAIALSDDGEMLIVKTK